MATSYRNSVSNLGMARAPFERVDPYFGFNFQVEIEGLVVGGFSKVDGLESTVETQDYSEGGRNGFVHKLPKNAAYASLVLSRGVTDSVALWEWHEQLRQGQVKRRNATLTLLGNERQPVVAWNIWSALPIKWVGPSFDATVDSQVAIERLELAHHGLTWVRAGA